MARTITVMSVAYRTFNKQHWVSLKEKLEKWKENLSAVNQNLSSLFAQPGALAVNWMRGFILKLPKVTCGVFKKIKKNKVLLIKK